MGWLLRMTEVNLSSVVSHPCDRKKSKGWGTEGAVIRCPARRRGRIENGGAARISRTLKLSPSGCRVKWTLALTRAAIEKSWSDDLGLVPTSSRRRSKPFMVEGGMRDRKST